MLNAQHLWHVAINWAMENPLKQEFFQQYSMSPSIPSKVREQGMNEILSFMGELIQQGQKIGIVANYPLSLMLEGCHGHYLATTRYFLDHPERWGDEVYKQASFSIFWNALKAE